MPVFASSPFRNTNILATPVAVSAGPCRLTGLHVSNVNTNVMYLHFYNDIHSNVTVGTTTPTLSLMIPGGSATAPGGCDTIPGIGNGCRFSTALSIAATTALTGNTAPGTGLNVNLFTGGA